MAAVMFGRIDGSVADSIWEMMEFLESLKRRRNVEAVEAEESGLELLSKRVW